SDSRDIDFTLADTATNSNFDIDIVGGNTVSISRIDGASTEAPNQLLLLENLDTDLTIADGLVINVATGGVITDGIDLSDDDIVNAINVGANVILGSTAVIDFTNFDVDGSGNVLIGGTLGVTGATTLSSTVDVTGTGTFNDDLTQSGTGAFTTGTGAVTLNGNTSISGANTLTVGTGATMLGGTLGVTAEATFNNNIVQSG